MLVGCGQARRASRSGRRPRFIRVSLFPGGYSGWVRKSTRVSSVKRGRGGGVDAASDAGNAGGEGEGEARGSKAEGSREGDPHQRRNFAACRERPGSRP